MKVKTAKEPLIRIAKRTDISTGLSYGIRVASVLIALIACGLTVILITSGKISFFEKLHHLTCDNFLWWRAHAKK